MSTLEQVEDYGCTLKCVQINEMQLKRGSSVI